jgi:hypothetical protein
MISSEEHLNNLVAHAYARVVEVYAYQTNIDNYTMMLAALPTDNIPGRLAPYSNVDVASLPHDMDDDDVQLISDYQYRDRLRTLLRTEKAEQNKSQRVLDSIKAQIGPTADTKIASYKATQLGS